MYVLTACEVESVSGTGAVKSLISAAKAGWKAGSAIEAHLSRSVDNAIGGTIDTIVSWVKGVPPHDVPQ